MNAHASEHFDLLVSCSAIRERQRAALRLHAGRGRRLSVKQLSDGTGVPEANIENAMRVLDCPAFRPLKQEELASIGKFLGPSFTSVYLELSGQGAFDLMDEAPLPGVLTAESAKPAETAREKVVRLQRELFNAIEELTA